MKAVLISIQPKWCEMIASGKKTIEVRKTRPKIETPFKCYIYCTKQKTIADEYCGNRNGHIYIDNGKVIGEFVCDNIEKLKYNCDGYGDEWHEWNDEYVTCEDMCLSEKELEDYLSTSNGYGWHISELKIYDKPKGLGEFRKPCIDKYQYCQSCKYGLVTLSPDEEEYAMYHGGYYDTFDTVCTNRVTRPPQSWCYVEELL